MSGDPLIPADKRRMLDEENIAMTMAYNFMSAFVACLVIILLGEWLAKLTKGWIPSVSLYFGSHYSVLLLDVSSEDRRCRLEAAARWQFCRHLFADRPYGDAL